MKDSNSNDDFLKTEFTFAVVIHASVEDIQRIKEYLSGLNDPQVIYQKISPSKLYITEEEVEE